MRWLDVFSVSRVCQSWSHDNTICIYLCICWTICCGCRCELMYPQHHPGLQNASQSFVDQIHFLEPVLITGWRVVPKLVEPHPTKLSSFKRFVRQPTHCVNWWHTYARVPLQILLRHPQDHAAPVWNDFNERGCQLVESCPTRRCKNHSL